MAEISLHSMTSALAWEAEKIPMRWAIYTCVRHSAAEPLAMCKKCRYSDLLSLSAPSTIKLTEEMGIGGWELGHEFFWDRCLCWVDWIRPVSSSAILILARKGFAVANGHRQGEGDALHSTKESVMTNP